MKIKLAGGAYQENYRRFNAQRCINWYPHYATQKEQLSQEKTMYLKPTPGLKEYVSVSVTGGNRIRASLTHDNEFYFIVNRDLFKLDGNTATNLGTMSSLKSGNSIVYLGANSTQIGIFKNNVGYTYTPSTDTLAEITDVDFPGAETLVTLDGFGLTVKDGVIHFCELEDFTDWRGDNKFNADYQGDTTIQLETLQGTLWVFGHQTMEPYYNDGSSPFVRIPNSSFDIGLHARETIGRFAKAFCFLAQSERGSLSVFRVDDRRNVDPISPGSINDQLNETPSALKTAYAIAEESQDSHQFYHLCVPDLNKTFTFDLVTAEWHERQSQVPFDDALGVKSQGHWRAHNIGLYRGKYLIGDYYSSTIFELDEDTLTEDGLPIRRERTSGPYSREQVNISVSDLVIDCSLGHSEVSDPKIMFSYSVDGGHTYRQEREVDLSELGHYNTRLKFRKLGVGRNWVVRLVLTDQVNLALFGAISRGSFGARA